MALPTRNTAVVGSATTVRPSATALFSVNSADRFRDYTEERNGTSTPYDFIIRKGESLLNGFFSRIAVTEIQFPFTLPNVKGSTEKIIVRTLVGGITTDTLLTIPAGFYTPFQIAASLQFLIRALPGMGAFTMQYGTSGNATFVYDTVSANQIAFLPVPQSATFDYGSDRIQLFDMLGFSTLPTLNSSLNTTRSGGYTLFQKYKYLDFVSTLLTGNQALKDATSATIDRNVLCRLYLEDGTNQHLPADSVDFAPNGTQPFVLYRQFNTPKQVAWDGRQPIGQLNFQVYDQDGYLLESYGYLADDWQMSLLVSEN